MFNRKILKQGRKGTHSDKENIYYHYQFDKNKKNSDNIKGWSTYNIKKQWSGRSDQHNHYKACYEVKRLLQNSNRSFQYYGYLMIANGIDLTFEFKWIYQLKDTNNRTILFNETGSNV